MGNFIEETVRDMAIVDIEVKQETVPELLSVATFDDFWVIPTPSFKAPYSSTVKFDGKCGIWDIDVFSV